MKRVRVTTGHRGGARVRSEEGKRRHSAAMTEYWEQYRLRKIHGEGWNPEADAAQKRQMRERCQGYTPKSIELMTELEIRDFAETMANNTAETLRIKSDGMSGRRRMTKEEREDYAGAIAAAIHYFNHRSERHADHMRYLSECRAAEAEARQIHKDVIY